MNMVVGVGNAVALKDQVEIEAKNCFAVANKCIDILAGAFIYPLPTEIAPIAPSPILHMIKGGNGGCASLDGVDGMDG